ncbi:MAG: 4'-phosphopantetheinyl transferase family protein [Gammaproteobacteria bacterium]
MRTPVCLFIARDDSLDRRVSRATTGARRQRRSECGATLLRIALGHATGTSPAAWSTTRTSSGRPVVEMSPPTAGRMRISLAHSGPYLAASTSALGRVAVDLEVFRERRFAEIARHLDWPAHIPGNGLAGDAFFHLWTLWEASIKLASDHPGFAAADLFASIVRETDAGRPGMVRLGTRIARSWRCAGRFWMSVLAENADEIRVFRLRSPPSDELHAEIEELFDRPGSMC